jgi:hypothetical protein
VLFVANDEVENLDGSRPPRPESEQWLGPLNLNPPSELVLTGVDVFNGSNHVDRR